MVRLPKRLAQLDGPLQAEIEVQDHVGEARWESEKELESVHPLVIERFEVLEVIDGGKRDLRVLQKGRFDVCLRVPGNSQVLVPIDPTMHRRVEVGGR